MRVFKQAAAGSGKRPFFYRDAGTLEIRSGRGDRLALFGFLFLLAGLFVMALPTGIIPITKRPEGLLIFSLMVLFGSALVVAGVVQVFGRSGLVLDRSRGRITKWYGLLVPMKRVETMLDAVRQVEMDWSRGDSDSADTWPVRLTGEGIPKPITVARPESFAEARQMAEELARFLQKPLVDSLTGEKVTRDPERLDESWRDRMRRTGETVAPVPPRPPGMCTRVEHSSEGLILHIPGPSLSWYHFIPALAPVAGGAIVIWIFLSSLPTRPMLDWPQYFLLGLVGLFLVAVPAVSALLNILRLKNQFERVTVTKAFLRVEALNRGKATAVEIPVDELEDLVAPTFRSAMDTIEMSGMKEVSPGDTGMPRMPGGEPAPRSSPSLIAGSRGLAARSDKVVAEFGAGLDEAESAYLFALIRKTIAE